MIKVLIADDHQIIIDGLRALLEKFPKELSVIGEASNGNEVLEFLKTRSVDLIFMDIHMPLKDGIETTKTIRKSNTQVKIIALTMYNKPAYIKEMMESGANGYILKNAGKSTLFGSIETVLRGDSYFDAKAINTLVDSFSVPTSGAPIKLTKREIEVLNCIAEGLTTNEIAEQLFISTHTVETHRKNLLTKVGVKNTAGLVKYAMDKGLCK